MITSVSFYVLILYIGYLCTLTLHRDEENDVTSFEELPASQIFSRQEETITLCVIAIGKKVFSSSPYTRVVEDTYNY